MAKISLKINSNDKLTNKLLKENEYPELESNEKTLIKSLNDLNEKENKKLKTRYPELKTAAKTIPGAINELLNCLGIVIVLKQSTYHYTGYTKMPVNYIKNVLSNPGYISYQLMLNKFPIERMGEFVWTEYNNGIYSINDKDGKPGNIDINTTKEQEFLLNLWYGSRTIWPIGSNKGSKLIIKLQDVTSSEKDVCQWLHYWGLGDPNAMGEVFILTNSIYPTKASDILFSFFSTEKIKAKIWNETVRNAFDRKNLKILKWQSWRKGLENTWSPLYDMDDVVLEKVPAHGLGFMMRWVFTSALAKDDSKIYSWQFWVTVRFNYSNTKSLE